MTARGRVLKKVLDKSARLPVESRPWSRNVCAGTRRMGYVEKIALRNEKALT
ncbi:hypothetical protein DO73_5266 [Burkholderia pseudomallei]|nr:hypothetical protein DO73_5266 [Burkholderia pseudomallei]